jgi:hypothetical protein
MTIRLVSIVSAINFFIVCLVLSSIYAINMLCHGIVSIGDTPRETLDLGADTPRKTINLTL